ncbi:MAG: transposase [Dehalococcoidia bacterium]
MKKSKENLRRRQREIEARLDPSWHPAREEPVLESGNIRYEVSGRTQAVACGGLGMLQAVVEATGLRSRIDESLHLLKRHLPYHESDHVLSLLYMVMTGGRCLEDLEPRRQDIGYLNALGAVGSHANPLSVSQVDSRWIDKAVTWVLDDAGFEAVRLRGDTDFALTQNFDRWSASGVEFVFGMDAYPGLVGRAEELDDSCWKRLQRPRRKARKRRRRSPRVKDAVTFEKGYRTLTLDQEHIAEIVYTPSKCRQSYRLVILRKRILASAGQLLLEDEVRYFFYVTNVPKKRLSTAAVVRESNARCDQENIIEQLKNGVRATRLPVREFDANWAYLVIGSLAWNLKAWAALLLPEQLGARAILRMEFRRFLDEIVLLPAQILTRGRRLVFRLLAINRWTRLLLEGTPRLKHHQFA